MPMLVKIVPSHHANHTVSQVYGVAHVDAVDVSACLPSLHVCVC